jgi:2-keto-3-deoxy-L-fuconate dehydrogenase
LTLVVKKGIFCIHPGSESKSRPPLCNAICPGTIHTPFVDACLARSFAGHEEEARQQFDARQPIGRMGRPDEIAHAALYLASDEAIFATGSALVIDGGLTAR